MSLDVPHQNAFFYQANWTPDVDSIILSTIIRLKKEQNWTGVVMPPHFLLEAGSAVYNQVGCRFTFDELYGRLQELETRYTTFKEVVRFPGTYWDVHTNSILASDEIWTAIFQQNQHARVYYHRGEQEFPKMATLFGFDYIKPEVERQVIVISDTTCPVEDDEIKGVMCKATSEEVTSPLGNPSSRLCRKLFQDEPQQKDRSSTNEKGQYYYVVGPDGEMKYKMQNEYPPCPPNEVKRTGSSHDSSCASSSPSKWWKNPFK